MSKIRKSWEAWEHFDAAKSLFEVITGILAKPAVAVMMAAIAGVAQGIPVMWIITGCSVVLASVMGFLLWFDQYKERNNPANKLQILTALYFQELNEVEFEGKKIEPSVALFGIDRTIDRAQLGLLVQNIASFPLSFILESAQTSIMGIDPPRSEFPKPPALIEPGQFMTVRDDRIKMNDMPCQPISGQIEVTIRYGRPGKEKYAKRFKANVDVPMLSFGIVSQANTSPLPLD